LLGEGCTLLLNRLLDAYIFGICMDVRRKLRKLRERDRKRDILYKVASIIEDLARENKAVVVIGDIGGDDKERMERVKGGRLMHRIHQWSVAKLIELLEDRPIHVVRISENGPLAWIHSR
jgi:putative transposase